MDALEIAHSITVEAIRAGVNRPDEILTLFERLTTQARGNGAAPAQPAAAPAEEPQAEDLAPPPGEPEPAAAEPPGEPPASPAPLPSLAWQEEPAAEVEEVPHARLSPEEIAASHSDDFLKCLECGQSKQQLKQHLRRLHELTPEQYKEKWGLPADYPMVAPATRRRFQERARNSYEKARAAGVGIAAKPGRKKAKAT